MIAFLLLASFSVGAQAEPRTLAPGLQAIDFECQIGDRRLQFRELRAETGRGLEFRALANPTARPNTRCRDGYGGPGFEALVKTQPDNGFEILGAVNGTLFRETTGKAPGYASNSLIWTKGQGLLAPWRRGGGGSIFVADSKGGHRFEIDTKKTSDLPAQLLARFPTMTLAVQSSMPLMDGKLDASGQFTHWSRCPDSQSSDWRCRPHARTLLCSRADNSISLITTPTAYPYDLANGLRVGGSCHQDCVVLYNLDGGGSTQMARLEAASGKFEMSGHRIETTQEGCSAHRPVNNYLVVGRERKSGQAGKTGTQ